MALTESQEAWGEEGEEKNPEISQINIDEQLKATTRVPFNLGKLIPNQKVTVLLYLCI